MMGPRFTEVIKVVNGELCNIDWHKNRIYRTSKHFFGKPTHIDFEALTIPEELRHELIKCRIVYNVGMQDVQFAPYSIRSIKTIMCIECDIIDYGYKYEDRSILNFLFEQRGKYDDILIVKNGWITDTFAGNVVFKDSHGLLYTPSVPLLPGTKRARLLSEKKIKECKIAFKDIRLFEGFYIINAMIDLEDDVFIKGCNIFG